MQILNFKGKVVMNYFLAVDIGASSGRHIIGYQENNEIKTKEVYRFSNFIDTTSDGLVWDMNRLFEEVVQGIKIAFSIYTDIKSISIDTWGVDYMLLDSDLNPILPCISYRDGKRKNRIEEVHNIISFEDLYKITGIQFVPFNTIYQMYDDKLRGRLKDARAFLMIPEYLNFLLTGNIKKEYTNATTTSLVDAISCEYSSQLIKKLGFDEKLFPKLSLEGNVGMLKEDIAINVGGNAMVNLCLSHDTASAFDAVDTNEDTIIISSGTWSIVGAKLSKPVINKTGREKNYSNEGGRGYIRYLKNLSGLFVITQLKKEFGYSYDEMMNLAKASTFKGIYDLNADEFAQPTDMSEKIIEWFSSRDEEIPRTKGDIFNSFYNSLATGYKKAVEEIECVTGRTFSNICILGGGAKDEYLNELTREYTKKNVQALPIEGTAIGNLKSQMRTYNDLIM